MSQEPLNATPTACQKCRRLGFAIEALTGSPVLGCGALDGEPADTSSASSSALRACRQLANAVRAAAITAPICTAISTGARSFQETSLKDDQTIASETFGYCTSAQKLWITSVQRGDSRERDTKRGETVKLINYVTYCVPIGVAPRESHMLKYIDEKAYLTSCNLKQVAISQQQTDSVSMQLVPQFGQRRRRCSHIRH